MLEVNKRALLLAVSLGALGIASSTSKADTAFTIFAYPATGSTANRTTPDRLSDVKNVLEFGADPTGAADSAAAIQAAVDAYYVYGAGPGYVKSLVNPNTTANGAVAAGLTTITVAGVPAGVAIGNCQITNVTNPASLDFRTQVAGLSGNIITLTLAVLAPGISNGDVIRFDFKNKGIVFFPPGTYTINSPIVFNNATGLSIVLCGCGATSNIVGNFPDYVLSRNPPNVTQNSVPGISVIEKLMITNNHAKGGGIRWSNTLAASIRDVWVSAHNGINMDTADCVTAAAQSAGGSGYAVNDTVTVAGGTADAAAVLTVTSVSGGAVTGLSVKVPGQYVQAPSNPASQASSSGGGTGCTINLTFGPGGAQTVKLENIDLNINGNYANSNGIIVGGGDLCTIDCTGFETGLRLYGVASQIRSSRFEVCGRAIMCGLDAIGVASASLTGFEINNVQFESNSITIDVLGGSGNGLIAACNTKGFETATTGYIGTAWPTAAVSSVSMTAVSGSGAVINGSIAAPSGTADTGVLTLNSATSGTLALNDILTGTGMYATRVVSKLSGTQGQAGSTYSVTTVPIYALNLNAAIQTLVVAGCTFGGQCALANINIPNLSVSRNTFISTTTSNASTVPGAKTWNMPTEPTTAYWLGCDNPVPIYTFGALPSGVNVIEGDEYNISDCNTSTFLATAAAGGSGSSAHRRVRWNASASLWQVVG